MIYDSLKLHVNRTYLELCAQARNLLVLTLYAETRNYQHAKETLSGKTQDFGI